jgi:hypothetical protein
MLPHQAEEAGLRGCIERRHRLIDQPERARRHKQPRKSDAPPLSG